MADPSDARDVLLNRLADEFAARQRAGVRPRVEEYCDRHPDLADDIQSLFPALVELERTKADAGPELAVDVAEAPPVTQLGDFRLLREVGRGGMGVVYEAEQDGDSDGAECHLDRLADLRPDDRLLPARRGRVLAAAGRKDEADAAYAPAYCLDPSPQVLSDWLRAAAEDNEAAGRKEAALWNLERAVALTPDDWTLYALRAGLVEPGKAVADFDEAIRRGAEPGIVVRAAIRAAETGAWKRSAALFNSLARNPALSAQGRYAQAIANLKAGDAAGYQSACTGIAKQLPPVGPKLDPTEANNAAAAFALGPKATDDWSKPVAWIDHSLARLDAAEKANPEKKDALRRERHVFLNTRGAVLLRAGRFEESAKALRAGMSIHPGGGEFHDWLFLALAEHRLGRADAAKEAAAKARAIHASSKPGTVWDKAEVELLAAELDDALPPIGK